MPVTRGATVTDERLLEIAREFCPKSSHSCIEAMKVAIAETLDEAADAKRLDIYREALLSACLKNGGAMDVPRLRRVRHTLWYSDGEDAITFRASEDGRGN
jgi:hypothetical protein